MRSMSSSTFIPPTSTSANAHDPREWMPQDGAVARRSLVVMGARIQPEWLDRSVSVVHVRFVGELGQVLGDLASLAFGKGGKSLPTVRLKASLALMLDGIILIDRHLGLHPDKPKAAIELYAEDADATDLIDGVRSCLKTWNNDVVQSWAQSNGFVEVAERLSRAITSDGISVSQVSQPLVQRNAGARLGRPSYHLIARRLAEELVGATLFEGMSPVDLVVDPANTTASVELLTQPVRMEGSKHMFSMAARLSVFTMPSSRDIFVKITPVKRIWSSDLPGRKANAPPSTTCTVMVPGKPFLTVRAVQAKPTASDPNAPLWRFSEDYEEFLRRSKGNLPSTLQDAVAEIAPNPEKDGWWVGFPRLTTLFDRIGGRTVFERDEFDLHENVVQMLPWALDRKLEFRRVKAVAQKAAADATHTALRPSDIGRNEDVAEAGRAGQALLDGDTGEEDRNVRGVAHVDSVRAARLSVGRDSNVEALRALYSNRPIHLFVFGGDENEQAIIRACADVLFGNAVQVHTEVLPLHTHGLKAELEKADAKSLERFEARVSRWEAAFAQLPNDGGARKVMICADRLVGRRIEDPVNYYAAIYATCRAAGANVHHVLPVQKKRGKDDIAHFVHRVQSAMLDVFLAHSGVILGVDELVQQTLGQTNGSSGIAPVPRFVVGIQALRSRARRRSAESGVSFILYTRLSLLTGLVDVCIACRINKKDHVTGWMDLASGLRWLGSQRQIASDDVWIKEAFPQQTRAMLSKLRDDDANAIVLIDWDRLKALWPNLRDEILCESASGTLMLANADLSQTCPGMTFVRLRSSRESSMTMRALVTKLYAGWASNGQAYESTGEVYTERYLGPAHEIAEVVASDAKERSKPGRTGNRHYLQVMRYRRTVQLQRGYSCYRSSERMKRVDDSENAVEAPSSKRFRLVKFPPAHDDAALPATTEVTIVTGPASTDADQVVRLVMGLRLRYAHYPDWTALPAPLFFISKVDDYVIPYADLLRGEEDVEMVVVPGDSGSLSEVIASSESLSTQATEADDGESQEPSGHDLYFDDVSQAIVEQLPQLQLFSTTHDIQGDTQEMGISEHEKSYGEVTPVLDEQDRSVESKSLAGDKDLVPEDDVVQEDGSVNSDNQQEAQRAREARRPKDDRLAKAWSMVRETPSLVSVRDPNIKRLYEDMMREQVRLNVELPWFINVNTIVPAEAWPDHKSINKYWRAQGNMGLRQPNRSAPSTGDFKTWVMRRLRMPQSAWTIHPQLFKGGARVFNVVFERYEEMLAEYAAEGRAAPEIPSQLAFNNTELAQWLRAHDDDEGVGWLVAMAAHWPDVPGVEGIFEAFDGMSLGPMASCALEYFVDCCELAQVASKTTAAQRKGLTLQRKRDPKWATAASQIQQAHAAALPENSTHTLTSANFEVGELRIADRQVAMDSVKSRDELSRPAHLADDTGSNGIAGMDAVSSLPQQDLPQLPEDAKAANALVKVMVDAVSRMSPGSTGYADAARSLRAAVDRMDSMHAEALECHTRSEETRKDLEAREEAERVERLGRTRQLEAAFEDLTALCESIPEELTHEPHRVPGSEQEWLDHALSLDTNAFDDWLQLLTKELITGQCAAAQILSAQRGLDALDNGTDERLSKVSGLARRQLQHKLQDEIIMVAGDADRSLAAALARIAKLNPRIAPMVEGTVQPRGALSDIAEAPESDRNMHLSGQEGATDWHEQVEGIAVTTAVGEFASAISAKTEASLRRDQADTAGAVASGPVAEKFPSTQEPAVARPAIDAYSDGADDEEAESYEYADAALDDSEARPIEEDTDLDLETLAVHLKPMRHAAIDRLWKLTRVGIAALCAIKPHVTVELHGAVWSSTVDSLTALTSQGAEQRLNDSVSRWLESDQAGPESGGDLGFALDVGVLGAGLLPILFEGNEAKARWAVLGRLESRLHDHKPLYELCQHLRSLDSLAFTITRENLSAARVGPRKALEAEIQRQRDRAATWSRDQALFSNWPNPEYWDMHNAMFDDRHGMHFHKALHHVSRGADEPLRKMLPDLRKYVDKISATLADLRKRTGRKRPLEGPHADKLTQNIAATIKFFDGYLDLTDRLNSEANNDTPKPLREFLDQLHSKAQAAQSYLTEVERDLSASADDGNFGGVLHLHVTLARQVLDATLSLMNEQPQPPRVADSDQMLLMDLPLNSLLEPVWSVKLDEADQETKLRDPLVVIAEVGSVQEQLAEASRARPQQTVEDLLVGAADLHRKNGEILAARAIEQRMRGAAPSILSQMQSANDGALRKQKSQFGEELSDARQRVTNALSVGPMTQAEASRMLRVVEMLDRANRENQIGAIASAPRPYEDYPQARAILRHHILEPLGQRIDESLRSLKSDMVLHREKLERTVTDDGDRARKIEQLDRIAASLADVTPTNIRVARYSFSLLEQDELPFIKLSATNAAEQYEAFQRDLRAFSSNHSPLESLRDALRSGDGHKHWPKGQRAAWAEYLGGEQKENAAAFLDAWIALTEARALNDIHDPLAAFFKAAGTAEFPTAMSEPGNGGRTAFHMPAKTFVGSARLQNFWVPPILGSAARDLRGVVLRHRPAPELMAQVIGELPMNSPTFVLGRTHLSLARRSAITRDHPVIIVDDDLVAYMAVHPEQRLAKMMEVGLLTFHDNPYDDYGGPVPTEMFFGRRSELVRLAGNKSAMVLYGGRRLGKSSLLDRIQFESRQNLVRTGDKARGEVAIYIPLESRIDGALYGDDHRLFAWMGIYRGMVNNDFIKPAKSEPKTADNLREYIRSEIMAGGALTGDCYLLIDEADEVMARDVETSGAFATSLRALCDDVRDVCRIRYVIAGLHNLTRMHTEGNTALAKADAIALQPFSSGQDILMGVELITKPLAALGFVFPKGAEDLPMRILAMCNFYPAFVQLYCKNLIQDLYNKRGSNPPTTQILAADLDKVERNKDFIGVMQEKFRYNLDLDKRYKAIALILADTYYSGTGVDQGLAGSEIRDLCQTMFPNHFSKTGEGAFPALLDEMEKLTVIDRKGGRFQLRTPHIATMMGSREDVDHKMYELSRETAPSTRILGETRPFLIRGNGNERMPFPMPSGWLRQLLHEEERSLTILVGNHLSGLSEIEGLKVPWTIGRDAQYEVKFFPNIDSARQYVNALRRPKSTDPDSRIVALPSRSWKRSEIGDYAALASSLSRPLLTLDQRQRSVNLRLVLIANPQQAWELAQMLHPLDAGNDPTPGTVAPPIRGWRVDAVPAWNDDAIYYRLKQVENQALPDHPDACERVLEATLGFGGEINKLLRTGLTFEGLSQCRDEIVRRIASSRAAFYDAIGWPASLDATDIRRTEELLALLDGEVRSEVTATSLAIECGVAPSLLAFVRWMGLLQESGDGTWRVPALYKSLITPAAGAAKATDAKVV
jgi:hypothetical protein